VQEFFGVNLAQTLARDGKQADLMVANNVLAHVPDINDFVGGFAALLKPDGVVTFEFPHLLELIRHCQFDTIYHEHFSYLSLTAVRAILGTGGLTVFDVQQLPTHGGSLRIFAQRQDTGRRTVTVAVGALQSEEDAAGARSLTLYEGFQSRVEALKNEFVSYLLEAKRSGRKVAAYGAAAKGNTLLNYAGIRKDLLPFVVDRNPAKQGKFMPGSRIPIRAEEDLRREKPDEIIILPWNLESEVRKQLAYAGEWNAQAVVAVPSLRRSVLRASPADTGKPIG
jgi:hypothetical protein